MPRVGIFLLGALLSASTATAYYHYIHYANRTAPLQSVPEKFDLSALPNRTVTFLVSETGPAQLAAGDSFASVLAQIRQAAQTWNAVETSELRVAFGGLFSPGIPQATPGGEVVFDELPPGVLAVGGPVSRADGVVQGPNGLFVPILRATVRLSLDLTRRPGPSFTEAFFTTLVHEMGHALGLQHTFTSGAMSTITRSTYRLRPLTADDVAGISLLYPTRDFLLSTGSIAGRVSSAGQGVHLASVVAIRPNGAAISTLTNPDGTYQIQGLPPDQYQLYTHSLPPRTQEGLGPGDLVLPVDSEGRSVPDTGPTETLFFPGTRDPQQALAIPVQRGSRIEGADFAVQRRSAPSVYDASVYSFYGLQSVKPAFVNATQGAATVAVRGPGLITGGGATPGLSIQFLGGAPLPANAIRPYGNPVNLAVDLALTPGNGTGPRHLVFSTPSDVYVLPAAVHVVQKQAPAVTAVNLNADGTVAVLGVNMSAETRIFFDGVPGTVTAYAGSEIVGTLSVIPPAGIGNRTVVTAYNPDGQNSTFLQSTALPAFQLDGPEGASIRVEPSTIPVGTDAMVEVTSLNTRFMEGQTVLGLGSGDVLVRRAWVLGPSRMLANVSVSPAAVPVSSLVSVVNGFQVVAQPFAFQVAAGNPRAPRINGAAANANTSQSGIFAGSTVTLSGANLAVTGNATVITVNDVRVNVLQATATQVTFQVPAGLPAGPAILRLSNGQENAPPVLLPIDAPPPVILSASIPASVRPGEVSAMTVSDPGVEEIPDPARVRVRFADQDLVPLAVFAQPNQPRTYQVVWAVPASAPPGATPVRIRVGDRSSEAVQLVVRGF